MKIYKWASTPKNKDIIELTKHNYCNVGEIQNIRQGI